MLVLMSVLVREPVHEYEYKYEYNYLLTSMSKVQVPESTEYEYPSPGSEIWYFFLEFTFYHSTLMLLFIICNQCCWLANNLPLWSEGFGIISTISFWMQKDLNIIPWKEDKCNIASTSKQTPPQLKYVVRLKT